MQHGKQVWVRGLLGGGFVGVLCFTTGCTTTPDGTVYWAGQEPQPQVQVARQELVFQHVQREVAMVKSQVSGIEQAQTRLVERLDRLEATNRDNARLREELAAVRRDLEKVRSERETMRKEIVDDLTTRINKYMATAASTPRPAPPAKQNGYMHTVVAGQKLADIAKAYKSTPSLIRKANNLKDDNLKAGQQLFIPE